MSDFILRLHTSVLEGLKAELLALASFVPDDFTALNGAIEDVARAAEGLYTEYLQGHPIPGRGTLKDHTYLKGKTQLRRVGALQWWLGHDDDAAKGIEEGRPAWDMKKDLDSFKKARRSKKDGSLYLIVPFRHGIPGTRGLNPMPDDVYKIAKKLKFSTVANDGFRTSATGFQVPKFSYQYGGKLQAGLAPKLKEGNKTDPYAGMYRFRDQGTPGAKKAAGYITFRTMSQKSPAGSWIRPAQPGLYPLKTAIEVSWNSGLDGLNAALNEDVVRILGGG